MRELVAFLRREPLVHFAALAGLLFLVAGLWGPDSRGTIFVSAETAAYLVEARELALGRELNPAERRGVVASFVEEEVLVREAYEMGLEQDGRIRQRLVGKMRSYLLGDASGEPTEADLRAYFDANRERYAIPAQIVVRHVSFADSSEIPAGLLEELRAGTTNALRLGQRHLLSTVEPATLDERSLAVTHGGRFANALFELRTGEWHGPLESARGVHFVFVEERGASTERAFEQVKPSLEQDWRSWRIRESTQRRVDELVGRYEVIVEGEEG